jgi:transcriptional regulator with XRE-family HTH domain
MITGDIVLSLVEGGKKRVQTGSETLGQRLARLGVEKGAARRKLAKYLELTPQSVYNYEHGTTIPSLPMIVRIASFYDLDVEQLLAQIDWEGTLNEYSRHNL